MPTLSVVEILTTAHVNKNCFFASNLVIEPQLYTDKKKKFDKMKPLIKNIRYFKNK